MFENVKIAPPDPILGLSEAFAKDPRPHKINLAVGVYKNAEGGTPVLQVVKQAERALLEKETTKGYKPIEGDPEFGRLVRVMLFGENHALVGDGRAQSAHTPGGTGALRVAADYFHSQHPGASVWISQRVGNSIYSIALSAFAEGAQLATSALPGGQRLAGAQVAVALVGAPKASARYEFNVHVSGRCGPA